MDEIKTQKLIELLINTQRAHHQHQVHDLDGQYNHEWPDWYADFLLENGLPELLGRSPGKEELTQFLHDVDEQHRAESPEQHWFVFYAVRLLDWS